MKLKPFPSTNQAGASLIEVLVSLIIFALIMLGSSFLMGQSLKIQKESTTTQIVTNIMQQRLQAAASSPLIQTCSSIDLTTFTIASTTYYVGCGYQTLTVNSTTIYWPVVAVSSTSSTLASTCAAGTASDTTSCYIVGK